jgi:hypothetical protein
MEVVVSHSIDGCGRSFDRGSGGGGGDNRGSIDSGGGRGNGAHIRKKNAFFLLWFSNGGRVGLCPCSHREGAGVSPDRTPDRLCCCDDPDPDPDPDRPYRDHRIDRVMIASPRGGLCRLSQAVVVAIAGSAQSTPCTRRVRSTHTVSGENIAAQKSMRANEFEMSWQTLSDQHLHDVVRQVTVLPF